MRKILVSGSTAYDYIMSHGDTFSNSIDKDNIDNLSVGFLINKLKKETGGTGLNIAYSLALLSEDAILLSSVGDDYIFDGFLKEKIDLTYIHKSEHLLSASGYIINDSKSNQITAFYPGAMDEAINTSVKEVREDLSYSIVSPNQKEAMLKHLKELNQLKVKTFFDPGQQIFVFTKEDLEFAIKNANYMIVNEYEYSEVKEKTGYSEEQLLDKLEKIVVTLGAKGSKILSKGEQIDIGSVPVDEVLDPTGAGDAYRAGMLFGLKRRFDWDKACKMGTIAASYCVQFHGAQNHFINKSLIEEDMKTHFDEDVEFF